VRRARVYVGNVDCKRRDDTHSTQDFASMDDAVAFMWGMAHTPCHKQMVWLFQGMDGWISNAHMRGMPIPEKHAQKAAEYINDEIRAHVAANSYEMDAQIKKLGNGAYSVYSRAANCECAVKNPFLTIRKLADSYREELRAPLGVDDVFVNVKIDYSAYDCAMVQS